MSARVLLSISLFAVVISACSPQTAPQTAAKNQWVELQPANAHHPNPTSLELVQAQENLFMVEVCQGHYEIVISADSTANDPMLLMSWRLPRTAFVQTTALSDNRPYTLAFEVAKSDVFGITLQAPYEPLGVMMSIFAINKTPCVPRVFPEANRPQTMVLSENMRVETLLGVDAQAQANLPIPDIPGLPFEAGAIFDGKDAKYFIELEWHDPVDLDLGSEYRGQTPILGWKTPFWGVSGLTGDNNRNCITPNRGSTEEFRWFFTTNDPATDFEQHKHDLRFYVTFHDDCGYQLRRRENPPPRIANSPESTPTPEELNHVELPVARFDLNLLEYVEVPIYEVVDVSDFIKLRPKHPVPHGAKDGKIHFYKGLREEKRVVAKVTGCEIRLNETWRFSLQTIIETLSCETGERVNNDLPPN